MDFPEPLYETELHGRRVCMACGEKRAVKVLRTTQREIVPLCEDCSRRWNVHGYQILKRIRPGKLISRLVLFKLLHPFQQPSLCRIWDDLKSFQAWAKKMKRWT